MSLVQRFTQNTRGRDFDLSGTFFSDGVQRGLKVNDLVIGIDTNRQHHEDVPLHCGGRVLFDESIRGPRRDALGRHPDQQLRRSPWQAPWSE
jgi:hypothetical protein